MNFVRLSVIDPQNENEPQPAPQLHHHLHATADTTRNRSAEPQAAPGADPAPDGLDDAPGRPVHVQDIDAWWPALPPRARLTLQVGWPEMGVPLTTTVLQLKGIDHLEDGVVSLL